jgi:Uncharacterized conserved protein
MGSPPDERGRGANEFQHEVTLTRGFWLADTACTQALWLAVMGGNPSNFKGAELPVEYVDWYKVQKFFAQVGRKNFWFECAAADGGRVGVRLSRGDDDSVCVWR